MEIVMLMTTGNFTCCNICYVWQACSYHLWGHVSDGAVVLGLEACTCSHVPAQAKISHLGHEATTTVVGGCTNT